MIEYKNSLVGITPENLKGFFVYYLHIFRWLKYYQIIKEKVLGKG